MKHPSSRQYKRLESWCAAGLLGAGLAVSPLLAIPFTQIVGPQPGNEITLPAGIAYQAASQGQPPRIIISHKTTDTGTIQRFGWIGLNGNFGSFGPALATGNPTPTLSKELKLIGIRDAVGGFAPGEVYSSDGSTSKILRINPDLSVDSINLSPAPGAYVRGFAHDTTGNVIGGDLACVTANGKVLRVSRSGTATLLATLTATVNGVPNVPQSLEPVLVIPPNSAKYGAGLAGKILVGAEDAITQSYGCWVVNPSTGTYVTLNSLAPQVPADIRVEDLDFIRPNEQLYAVDNSQGYVNILDATLNQFIGADGEILITSEESGEMRRLLWTGTSYQLLPPSPIDIWWVEQNQTIPAAGAAFEHAVFAPIYVAPKVSVSVVSGATRGDTVNRGVFRIRRDRASDQILKVGLRLPNVGAAGIAIPGSDYELYVAEAGGSPVHVNPTTQADGLFGFDAEFPQDSSKEIEVQIAAISNGSGPEEIQLQVVAQRFGDSASKRYLPADSPNNLASMPIYGPTENLVDLLPTKLTAEEALSPANSPGVISINRSSSAGDLAVFLATPGGSATYGLDYSVRVFIGPNPLPEEGFDGTVFLPNGVGSARLEIVPIDDSRAENNETVVLSLLPDASYQLRSQPGPAGAAATQTVTIADGEDSNQLPALGYWLTEVGPASSAANYAYGVNTVPDGYGGLRGLVVGNGFPASGQSGFRWNNGISSLLTTPSAWYYLSGQKSAATFSHNDAGTAVGQCVLYNAGTYTSSASYWPGTSTAATPLNGLYNSNGLDNLAQDINQRNMVNGIPVGGLIVGQSKRADGKLHAVVWIPNASGVYGNAVDLNDLGNNAVSKNSYASAINDRAQVVGRSQLASGNNYHGFVTKHVKNAGQWEPVSLAGSDNDMGTATGINTDTSEFNDINSQGEIVGRGHTDSGQIQALYKAPGSGRDEGYYDLGVLAAGTANAGTESVANGISSNGIIVGMSKVKVGASQVWRAFVSGNAGSPGSQPLVNLNDLAYIYTGSGTPPVLATSQGWTLVSAERINRIGWIAGYGVKNGQNRAFMLSPR